MRETIDTVIIGAGQAGLSLSYYLCLKGHSHVVLEKASGPGSVWRDQRWDSFTLVTPNWSFALPGAAYDGDDPDGFMLRDEVVRRFEQYMERNQLPVRFNTTVTAVQPEPDGQGFLVRAGEDVIHAKSVVLATGFFQRGRIPEYAASIPQEIYQVHSGSYRNPQSLPPGAVLVVGSGQSGSQIVEELYQSGRKVFLSTGSAPSGLRRYRGQEIFYWLLKSGFLDRTVQMLPSPAMRNMTAPALTGKNGGHSLSLHQFYRDGVTLLGHIRGYENGRLVVAPDLHENLGKSDGGGAFIIKLIDEYIAREGLDIAPETLNPDKAAYQAPEVTSLDLQAEGIKSIIWACGYTFDAKLVDPLPLDGFGFPIADRGVTPIPGLYIVGLPWQPKFKSGFIYGTLENSEYLADKIAGQPAGGG